MAAAGRGAACRGSPEVLRIEEPGWRSLDTTPPHAALPARDLARHYRKELLKVASIFREGTA